MVVRGCASTSSSRHAKDVDSAHCTSTPPHRVRNQEQGIDARHLTALVYGIAKRGYIASESNDSRRAVCFFLICDARPPHKFELVNASVQCTLTPGRQRTRRLAGDNGAGRVHTC